MYYAHLRRFVCKYALESALLPGTFLLLGYVRLISSEWL